MPDSTLRDNLPSGMSLHHTLQGHNDVITQIAWSPDGATLASASIDRTLRLWDPNTGVLRRTIDGGAGSIYSVAWSPDGKLLASGSTKGVIAVWNAETGELYRTIVVMSDQPQQNLPFGDDLEDLSKLVCSVEWLADGQTIAAGSTNNYLMLWNVDTGERRPIPDGQVQATSGMRPIITKRGEAFWSYAGAGVSRTLSRTINQTLRNISTHDRTGKVQTIVGPPSTPGRLSITGL